MTRQIRLRIQALATTVRKARHGQQGGQQS